MTDAEPTPGRCSACDQVPAEWTRRYNSREETVDREQIILDLHHAENERLTNYIDAVVGWLERGRVMYADSFFIIEGRLLVPREPEGK